jgi:hypothetical protein
MDLNELKVIIDERDRTYQQRWEASEKATVTALNATKDAVAAAFVAQEKAIAAALIAAERAVSKSEIASEKRFDAVNEFRAQLSDQASTFLPRAEFDRVTTAIMEKIDASSKSFTERLDDLRMSRDLHSGKAAGFNSGWGYLIAAGALIYSILAIVSMIRKW